MKKIALIVLVVAILIGLCSALGILMVQSYQNSAIKKETLIESSESDLNAEYNRRAGLLVNLAEAVKSYDKHEAEVLIGLSAARTPTEGKGDVNASLYLKGVVERYPQLRSIENYDRYMTELAMTENRIAQHRKYYNAMVREYQAYVKAFPARMFLDMVGYQAKDFAYLEFKNAPVDAPTGLLKDDK